MQIETRLLLAQPSELDALDESVAEWEEEEFDSILADAHLDVLNLLEEEILLSLPIAPKHESGACQATDSETRAGRKATSFCGFGEIEA